MFSIIILKIVKQNLKVVYYMLTPISLSILARGTEQAASDSVDVPGQPSTEYFSN